MTHIAEETVEGAAHFAEQASDAAHKSVDAAASAMPSIPGMPLVTSLNLNEIKSPREWEIPGASLFSPKKSTVAQTTTDPYSSKKLAFK